MNPLLVAMGWTGTAFLLLGTARVGGKNRDAFVFFFLGECLWITKALCLGLPDLALLSFLFGIMAVVNFIRWGRTA